MGWEDVVTEFDNFYRKLYRKESIAAINELMETLEEQTTLQEKYTPVTWAWISSEEGRNAAFARISRS